LPTVITLRATSMRAGAVDLRGCFSPATSWAPGDLGAQFLRGLAGGDQRQAGAA
jgi:hypothetical protein